MAKRTPGTPRRTSHTQAPQPNPHTTADRTTQPYAKSLSSNHRDCYRHHDARLPITEQIASHSRRRKGVGGGGLRVELETVLPPVGEAHAFGHVAFSR
ncbi:hypothetical protein PI124_g1839 [Phytophthora idaei]|nr:hypothetical protein PI125_g1595 [Phytophthora idaei]KAG3253569.1 hypothetical protein PI124_g1839 [Phytophthora idaei]